MFSFDVAEHQNLAGGTSFAQGDFIWYIKQGEMYADLGSPYSAGHK